MSGPVGDRCLEAIEGIHAAVTNAGLNPEYHRAIMARHRHEWPELWRRIDEALAIVDDTRQPPALK